ncbi:MAG TPA: MSHA biogenesis protein MshK [Burkholderiales bacterium]|nr:MSHA biogenesis protein MshK [Burkholderiales bacterium]
MKKAAALSLAFLLATAAHAMTDPTRPPPAFDSPTATAPRASPTLQSVIITGNTRAAIIDGERVEVGARVGEAQVVGITEEHVVLRQHGVTEVLKLYPAIEKKSVRAFTPKTPLKGAQR